MDGAGLISRLITAGLTLTIASGMLLLIIVSSSAQPQPRVGNLQADPDWLLLEFDNGSQWYMKSASVQAIWALPKAEGDKVGYRTVIYGTSYKVTVPYEVSEIEKRLMTAKASHLLELLQEDGK